MSLRQSRRGRPKMNRPTFDLGTIELQKKRLEVSSQNTHDLKLSESLLGICHARGLISKDLYEAGTQYYALGYRFQPQLHLNLSQRRSHLTSLGEPKTPNRRFVEDDCNLAHDEKIAKLWKGANQSLQNENMRAKVIVTLIVFYDGDLHADGLRILKKLTPCDLLHLKSGLTRLAIFFNGPRTQNNSIANLK